MKSLYLKKDVGFYFKSVNYIFNFIVIIVILYTFSTILYIIVSSRSNISSSKETFSTTL